MKEATTYGNISRVDFAGRSAFELGVVKLHIGEQAQNARNVAIPAWVRIKQVFAYLRATLIGFKFFFTISCYFAKLDFFGYFLFVCGGF